jgi:hypothetical protein
MKLDHKDYIGNCRISLVTLIRPSGRHCNPLSTSEATKHITRIANTRQAVTVYGVAERKPDNGSWIRESDLFGLWV